MPTPILLIELALPELPTNDAIGEKSWFLRSCASFPERFVLAFGAPSFEKNESHGKLFTQLGALTGDHYQIELAAVLAERLPTSKEGPEYSLAVAGTRAKGGLFCVSNVMQVIRYRKNDTYRHAVCQAIATKQFLADHKDNFSEAPHVEYLPSVVSARYDLSGTDAESALSNHLESTVDDFIGGINTMVAAHVASIDTARLGIINPVYDRGSFPWIYMIIRGEGNQFDAQRIATSLLRTTLVPQPYEDDSWHTFRAYASGEREVDVAVKALRSAESYIQAGAYDFALLLVAIAVELATTRFVHARLQAEGVPKKKLKQIKRDLTFSIMLSTHVIALTPADRKPDPQLLAQVDRIRTRRNDLMHKGHFAIPRVEIVAMVRTAELYIDYLARVAAG